ncbi:type II secretion system minor pseudopilin GspH [Marinospirillum minutulum]|uniref:type II secretion system minor pseudopilin GspH n=1 Tax=Marinospirillum minutulum TaxID=64974 RepID=UPI00055C5A8A|nr:type II secretion system minor pseudopilin GspH [Marinospirillum minutulum]
MRISATGIYKSPIYKPSTACKSQGFTLLEVLVVLFIIGITASIAVVTMQRSEQDLVDKQARQLLEDFSYARDLALNRYRLVGWQVTESGYRFTLRDELGLWQPYISRGLPERQWPEGVRLQGLSEESALSKEFSTEFSENLAPSLVFFPAGEVTALSLTLQLGEAERSLRVQAGHFELLDLPAEPSQ